ncbi:MAG: hypothetical protein CMJ81_18485 [Planctomycetaceae bacterium]|nr:hypothetical protein [Planctomycetaceae bacterium]
MRTPPRNPEKIAPEPRSKPCGRRGFLQTSSIGVGSLALRHLLQTDGLLASSGKLQAQPGGADQESRRGHFDAPAKSVIMLVQTGGPSQMDLFDPKPELQKRSGQRHVEQVEAFQPGSQDNTLLGSPFQFKKHGNSGMEFSELLPHIGSIADDLCLVRSMYSENNNHPQATRCLNTGKIFPHRPALGSWITYALGTENQNLPAYVVLRDPDGYANGGTTLWDNGWLPAMFRGTEIQSRGAAVLNLHPTEQQPPGVQENNLKLLAELNEQRRALYPLNNELEARIRNYELAARMQQSAQQILDLSGETEATGRLYGLDNPTTENYGTRCLMARRMVESGVRFVQVLVPVKIGGMPWDQHSNLQGGLKAICPMIDQPTAGLIKDLKQRGLLESTIVIWSGEFGRLPISQHGNGRDHNRNAFSLLLAGGGFQQGYVHGATDDLGYRAAESRVGCPDLHATLLHQLGLDHTALYFPHAGREETLTDPEVTGARVISTLLQNPVRIG